MLSLPHTWEDVADWADSRPGARPAAYLAWKRTLQDAAVRALLADFPELVGHVVHAESSTGLTTLWHTRSPLGAEFGHYHSVSQMGRHRPAQVLRLKGLVQVGQGSFIPGILGATLSSYYGVGHYLGFDRLLSEMEAA
jgi:phytoene dehydrogenase-like protein